MSVKETLGDIWSSPIWGAIELLIGWIGGNVINKVIAKQKPLDRILITDVIQLIYDYLTKIKINSPKDKNIDKIYSLFVKLIKSAQIELNFRENINA